MGRYISKVSRTHQLQSFGSLKAISLAVCTKSAAGSFDSDTFFAGPCITWARGYHRDKPSLKSIAKLGWLD